jgi:hypothetical protein
MLEELNKKEKQKHAKHIEAGIKYDENCYVCKVDF